MKLRNLQYFRMIGYVVGRQIIDAIKGGPTSGNYGHAGRPGERGGSAAGGGHARIGITKGMDRNARMNAISDYAEYRDMERTGKLELPPAKIESDKPEIITKQVFMDNNYIKQQEKIVLDEKRYTEKRIAEINMDIEENPNKYSTYTARELSDTNARLYNTIQRDKANLESNPIMRPGSDVYDASARDSLVQHIELFQDNLRLSHIEYNRRMELSQLERKLSQINESLDTGKMTFTEIEMAKLLANPRDTYRDHSYVGEYNPDLFLRSDLSGRMVRHYIKLPDGRIGHPDELIEAQQRGRLIVLRSGIEKRNTKN